jgi:hypothetical protein
MIQKLDPTLKIVRAGTANMLIYNMAAKIFFYVDDGIET